MLPETGLLCAVGGTNVQFLFGDHLLDRGPPRAAPRRRAPIAVEPQVFDLLIYLVQQPRPRRQQGRPDRSVWGGRVVSEFDPDQPHQCRAQGGRRQRCGAETDPHHCPQGPALRRRRAIRPLGIEPSPEVRANQPSRSALPLPDRPAIAVLPFVNMSGDPDQEYFSDGISEDIITALSKLRWFFVIARNSSFTYKGKAVHMKQIAEELGVGYVVEGSVRKSGDRVRITAQLNDVATGSHIWAERYDRDIADVFAVQDEITEAIVAAIEPQLYAAENFRAQRKAPDSMDAWDLVMRALSHYWRVTRQDNVVAQALLEKATAIDPNYGQALGVLAASQTFSAHMGWADMAAVVPTAERAAHAAIRADGEDPWAHYALGNVYLFTRRFDNSLAEFELALQLNPNFSLAQGLLRPGAGLLRPVARGRSGREPCAAIEPTRSIFSDLLRHRRLLAIRWAQLRRGHAVGARSYPPAQRFRRRSQSAHRRRRHGRSERNRQGRTAGASPRTAQYLLDWIVNQMPFKRDVDRSHYVEGFRRAGMQ